MGKKEKVQKPPRKKLRTKLRERLTAFWEAHRSVLEVLDLITWGLSGLFVLAFLFWFHDHPYRWAIGIGLIILLIKLLFIVINPKIVEKLRQNELEKQREKEERELRK